MIRIPICLVRFDSSTFIFAEALPLLKTPKFGGGSIYARLDKIINQATAYRKPTLPDAGGSKPVHQRETRRELSFFLVIRAVLRIIVVLFLGPCTCLDVLRVHNLPPGALALPPLCEPCYIRKFRCTVENGKTKEDLLAKCSSSVSLRARRSLRAGYDVPDFVIGLFLGFFCFFGETAS